KLRQEEKTGRVYRSADTSACAMFMISKIDKPHEARYLHDLVTRNQNTYLDPPNLPDQTSIINAVANAKFRSKIDLSDGYHNIRIFSNHEKHTAFITPFGTYRTRVMQQEDCNVSATFQSAMNNLFKEELGVFVY